jgi:Animal haem peroxidase
VIADFRNDSNLVISGLHAAFAAFHNNAVDHVTAAGTAPIDAFVTARRLTTWHYQWLALHQFLPMFVGQNTVDAVLHSRRRTFRPEVQAFVPVEWSGAAFRFGHSMVRPSYRANLAGDGGQPFFGLIFDSRLQLADGAALTSEPDDLRGGYRAARRFIGWQTFFDFGGAHTADVRPNKVIDTVLSTPLFALPFSAVAHLTGDPGPMALPQRTLLRHLTWSLPSGQRVARRLGLTPLHRADLSDFGAYGHDLDTSTPLWLYVLREAQLVTGGRYLGPVGGRLVAEVLIGPLEADPTSYLAQQPHWHPTLGASSGAYTMANFLTFAGVDPDSRGQ